MKTLSFYQIKTNAKTILVVKMQFVPIPPEALAAHVNLISLETRSEDVSTSMSARRLKGHVETLQFARMLHRATIAFVLKDIEPNQMRKLLANKRMSTSCVTAILTAQTTQSVSKVNASAKMALTHPDLCVWILTNVDHLMFAVIEPFV